MSTTTTLEPVWLTRLNRVFEILETRRSLSLKQGPVPEDDFRQFVQNTAIPAFRAFRDALAAHGDTPEYAEGEDWVGFRWANGHTLGISPLLRAPGRAASALNFARLYRDEGSPVESVTDVLQDDVLQWLVRHYSSWRRVADEETAPR